MMRCMINVRCTGVYPWVVKNGLASGLPMLAFLIFGKGYERVSTKEVEKSRRQLKFSANRLFSDLIRGYNCIDREIRDSL